MKDTMSKAALTDAEQNHLHLEPVGHDQHFIWPVTGDLHTPVQTERALNHSIIKPCTDFIEMIMADCSQSMFALRCQLRNPQPVNGKGPEQVDDT